MSLVGQQIDRSHLLRLVGSGRMGEVYLAEDARRGQQVALKAVRCEKRDLSRESNTPHS